MATLKAVGITLLITITISTLSIINASAFNENNLSSVDNIIYAKDITNYSNYPETFLLGPNIMYDSKNVIGFGAKSGTRKYINDGWSNSYGFNVGTDPIIPSFTIIFDSQKIIGSFRVGTSSANKFSSYFRMLVSKDGIDWEEVGDTNQGCQCNAMMAQPKLPYEYAKDLVIDSSTYKNIFEKSSNEMEKNPLPYPTQFIKAYDEININSPAQGAESPFSIGQFKNRTYKNFDGTTQEMKCFAAPQFEIGAYDYGRSGERINYLGYYFFEKPVTAKYVKVVGYGSNDPINWQGVSFTELGFNEPSGNTFSDIVNHWAKEYVTEQSTGVVVSGYSDGTFRPENSIQRQEFAKMITLATYLYDNPYGSVNLFNDVRPDAWYTSYIAAAKEYGVLNGISDIQFGIDLPITRQDAATAIARALVKVQNFVLPTESETKLILSQFGDRGEIADYAKASVAMLVREGIVKGYSENGKTTFKPTNEVKRGEVCKLLSDAVKAKVAKQINDTK